MFVVLDPEYIYLPRIRLMFDTPTSWKCLTVSQVWMLCLQLPIDIILFIL